MSRYRSRVVFNRLVRSLIIIAVVMSAIVLVTLPQITTQAACSISNPLLSTGQDPSIWYRNGNYYLVQSGANNAIYLRAATTLGGLGSAANRLIWTAPAGTDHSAQIWAPELEYLNGQWIIYFAAATEMGNFDATNNTHRIFAIRANSDDPFGAWTFMGKVQDPTNEWAIDATVFFYNNNWYMLWSGTPPGVGGKFPQQIYIAHMSDPLHVDEPYRKLIANPDQAWETSVAAIEEGPEAFIGPGNKLTIVYSANASWTSAYNLGMLVYNGGDMGVYTSYTKRGPYMGSANGVYGPGHISLPVPAMTGATYKDMWLVYHAKKLSTDGWDDRAIFAQPQNWNADGTPNLGSPRGYTSFDENTGTTCTVPTNTPVPPTKTNTPVPPTLPPSGTNLALNKPATSSGNCATTEGPEKAVNGSVSGGNADKWCGNAATKWMQVDLTATFNVTQFIVRHAGAGGESTSWNTNAFNIQLSTDNVNWTTVVTVTGNTANVTTNTITARAGRYARLNITNAGGDGVARIYEFEVYGSGTVTPTNTSVPPATATRTNTPVPVPTNTPNSGATAWAPNVTYTAGQLVTYGGHTYKCLQSHTSQVGWEPPNVPALWQLVS